jgi:hypothetical protein
MYNKNMIKKKASTPPSRNSAVFPLALLPVEREKNQLLERQFVLESFCLAQKKLSG